MSALTTTTYDVEIIATLSELKSRIPLFLAAQDVKERTLDAYSKNIAYFFTWAVEYGTVESREDIIEYKQHLIDRKLKNTSINAYLTTVRRFYAWLYDRDIVAKDYAKSVKSVKVSNSCKKDPLTEDQWMQVLDTIDLSSRTGRRDYIMLLLGANYGLRGIEISRLNRGDIVITQEKYALSIWGKGHDEGDKELIPVRTDFAHMLLDFIGDIEEDAPVFTSLSNNSDRLERLSVAGVRYAVSKRFTEAGIKSNRISLHSLRHTFAVDLHKAKTDLLSISRLLRHKSTITTQIYLGSISLFDNPASCKLNKMNIDELALSNNSDSSKG